MLYSFQSEWMIVGASACEFVEKCFANPMLIEGLANCVWIGKLWMVKVLQMFREGNQLVDSG